MIKRMAERGFTLIELLVVIAIIGILAGVVLTSLGSARSSANDSKVKSQLASMRAEGEIIFTNTSSYATVCTATASTLRAGLNSTCNVASDNSTWAAAAPLTGAGGFWCVDSTGASRSITNALGSASVCP